MDIFAICETWLTSSIASATVNIDGFSFYRNDSPTGSAKHGVGIFVKNSIKVGKVDISHPKMIYRPPSNSMPENVSLASFVDFYCRDKDIILLGDFNLPGIDWVGPLAPCTSSRLEGLFLDMFLSVGLKQWVDFSTFVSSGNVLDLVLTTDNELVSSIYSLEPLPGCGHVGVSFKCCFSAHEYGDSAFRFK